MGICPSTQRMRGVTIPQDHQSVRDKSRAWRRSAPAERSGRANKHPRIVHARIARTMCPARVFIHGLSAIELVTLPPEEAVPDRPRGASIAIRKGCLRVLLQTLSPVYQLTLERPATVVLRDRHEQFVVAR